MEPIQQEQLKVLWWANAPYCPTGYGVGTRGVVDRIKHLYDLRILCFWGLEGRALFLNDILHYPKWFSPLGDDAARLICNNWKPDLLITFFDIWVGEMQEGNTGRDFFNSIHDHWVPWIPVDHDPSPIGITNQARKAYHPVTMSKFGQEALRKEGIENTYIPLGVDTSTFKPTEDKGADVSWSLTHSLPLDEQNYIEWQPDDFIIGINAAPKDPVRKNFTGMFEAFQTFLDQNPDARKDARMYLQSTRNFPTGWPLGKLARDRDVSKYIRMTHPYNMYLGFNDDSISRLTRSWDVHMNLATREGFGLSIIEACASGVPPITSDFTSMPELTKGHGWCVDYTGLVLTNLLSYGCVPDTFEAAEAIGEAYNSPDKTKELGEKARTFSLDYDWNLIANQWSTLIDKLGEDIRWKPVGGREIQ